MTAMMKVLLILVAAGLMFTLSACSSFSVSGKAGKIKVDTKTEQPKVIVNSDGKHTEKIAENHS